MISIKPGSCVSQLLWRLFQIGFFAICCSHVKHRLVTYDFVQFFVTFWNFVQTEFFLVPSLLIRRALFSGSVYYIIILFSEFFECFL